MDIISQSFEIRTNASKALPGFGLVVSVRSVDYQSALLVVGAPGMPNTIKSFELGDALLYETPTIGIVEVRLSSLKPPSVDVLATKVSPRAGLTAGLESDGGQNSPFSKDEQDRIRVDLARVLEHITKTTAASPEQIDLLSRKLDEIGSAAERMGRKDWLMFAAGTLTNVVVGAAFAPETTKALFSAMNSALGWVFQNTLRLLGG